MRELWSTELTAEEEQGLLESAANEIRRRKLEAPAVLMLEINKPLANVGSQAAVVFSPFLIPFLGFKNVDDYSRLFSKRENFERLIRLLEERKPEIRAAKKEKDKDSENIDGAQECGVK